MNFLNQKFKVKPDIAIFLHFRLGQPSHISWSIFSPKHSPVTMKWDKRGNTEITHVHSFLKNEEDFYMFIITLAEMHDLKAIKLDVAGDIPRDVNRCIGYKFLKK